jgi:endonuclease/exonuclease/phosphatase (EEP) superfamily protein YafD
LPQFREDQYEAVLDDVDPEARFVIIGGDFNSFTDTSIRKIEDTYSQMGFSRVSNGSGGTVIKYGIELTSDHIFAKGFVVEEVGNLTEATASDHLPIWVKLILNR